MSEMSSCPKIDLIYKSLGIIVGVCGGVVSFLNFVVKLIEYNAASKQLGRYSYNAISTCKYDLIFAVFIFFLFCIVLILFVLFKKITFWWNFVYRKLFFGIRSWYVFDNYFYTGDIVCRF